MLLLLPQAPEGKRKEGGHVSSLGREVKARPIEAFRLPNTLGIRGLLGSCTLLPRLDVQQRPAGEPRPNRAGSFEERRGTVPAWQRVLGEASCPKEPRTAACCHRSGGKAGRGSPLTFKHTKTNNRKKKEEEKKKLKPSGNASLFPRRVIKAFWQSEVVFILVLCCVAALTPSAVGAVRRRT